MIAAPSFAYRDSDHSYYLAGQRIPSITQLIKLGGLLGSGADFYTEESRLRGTEVHQLCTDWDLGALDVLTVTSSRRPYLLAYIAACDALKPTWEAIEEADVHPGYRFAGRTDRVGSVFGKLSVVEIKSGAKPSRLVEMVDPETEKTFAITHATNQHAVQTAAQAILASARWPLPYDHWQRLVIYVKHSGKFSVEKHEDKRDFDVVFRLIREFCR